MFEGASVVCIEPVYYGNKHHDIMMLCMSKSQDDDIMGMCLSKSQDDDIMMTCL